MVSPSREDHFAAAELRNACRRAAVQMGTIDAVLAQLCIHPGLKLLTTDKDFSHASLRCPSKVWA
jgi:predicted nucleic acid-binding protein